MGIMLHSRSRGGIMKLKLEIKDDATDKVLFSRIMKYDNGKIKFMPGGRCIKDAIKEYKESDDYIQANKEQPK